MTSNPLLNQIKVILVAPKYSGNVGACARVATNFAATQLCVVASECDVMGHDARLFGRAEARETLSQIKSFTTLAEAVADCQAVVAFTRRYGNSSPAELAFETLSTWLLAQGADFKTAFVFGREDNCLTRDELRLCTHYCTIPTSAQMPTLNLSHALAVVLSRVYADLVASGILARHSLWHGSGDKPVVSPRITHAQLEDLLVHFKTVLQAVRLTRGGNPERMLLHMRHMLQRAELTTHDAGVWQSFLARVQSELRAGESTPPHPSDDVV